MKKSTLIAAMFWMLASPLASCKKFIEQQEQNAVVKLVTQGTWRVTGYYDHQSVNLTDSFSGYSFQFNDNGTVYGTRYGQQQWHLHRRRQQQIHYLRFSVSPLSRQPVESYLDDHGQLYRFRSCQNARRLIV